MIKPLRAADLLPGDLIDFEPIFEDFAVFAAEHSNLVPTAERDMFRVEDVERETFRTYMLHTDHVSIEVPSEYTLHVERRR